MWLVRVFILSLLSIPHNIDKDVVAFSDKPFLLPKPHSRGCCGRMCKLSPLPTILHSGDETIRMLWLLGCMLFFLSSLSHTAEIGMLWYVRPTSCPFSHQFHTLKMRMLWLLGPTSCLSFPIYHPSHTADTRKECCGY